jgi:hypothetical protein
VFPSYLQLLGPNPILAYPSGGMFWARLAALDPLRDDGFAYSAQMLKRACNAAGLTQAVTHVPGVFW